MDTTGRQRATGDREREILDAAIGVLLDVGYDKLTFDLISSTPRPMRARRRSTASGRRRPIS